MVDGTGRWLELSDELASLVERGETSVVRVEGRRRSGSGVVWSADGAVVTAAHALGAEDEVEIGLPEGATVRGEVVGADPGTDLAVVRAAASGLTPPAWAAATDGAGALRAGSLALALSRPGRTVRAALGVLARVSDAFRSEGGGRVERYVELDFGGHPGFSGALVTDLAGRPIGVGNAGLVRGSALAVPVATVRRVVTSILAHGRVRRGYLGLATFPVRLPRGLAEAGAAERRSSGLLVTGVEPDGPSDRAGLLLGDLLLALDGVPLAHPGDLLPLLEEERIGAPAIARVWRAGRLQDVTVTIGARGDDAP